MDCIVQKLKVIIAAPRPVLIIFPLVNCRKAAELCQCSNITNDLSKTDSIEIISVLYSLHVLKKLRSTNMEFLIITAEQIRWLLATNRYSLVTLKWLIWSLCLDS